MPYKRAEFIAVYATELRLWGKYEEMLFGAATEDPALTPGDCKHLFRMADKRRLRTLGDPLPEGDSFVVYRGIGTANRPSFRRSVYWTLNPHTAAWFAARLAPPTPVVYTLTVPKEKVFYYRKGEQELAVDVWACGELKRVEPMPYPIPSSQENDALMHLGLTRIQQFGQSKFRCGPGSVHGPAHWQRVLSAGVAIASEVGADVVVVALFALLHDVCRLDDGGDPDHGKRAAELIDTMQGDFFKLKPAQLKTLLEACRLHTAGKRSRDVTIGTCWDADRLDLGRVGITPDPKFMSTAAGRKRAQQPKL